MWPHFAEQVMSFRFLTEDWPSHKICRPASSPGWGAGEVERGGPYLCTAWKSKARAWARLCSLPGRRAQGRKRSEDLAFSSSSFHLQCQRSPWWLNIFKASSSKLKQMWVNYKWFPYCILPIGKSVPRTRGSFRSPRRFWYLLAHTLLGRLPSLKFLSALGTWPG